MALRAVESDGPLVLHPDRSVPAGAWLAGGGRNRMSRDRRGLHTLNSLIPASALTRYGVRAARPDRLLTTEQLWQVYWRTPDVRACVDSIVRRVATWDWRVVADVPPDVPEDSPLRAIAEKEADDVARWLAAPNKDGETWQELWTKADTDLLVFDAEAVELVEDGKGDLAELVALLSDEIVPERDGTGRLERYVQAPYGVATSAEPITFAPDELLYLNLFPNTSGSAGRPLIETVLDQAVTLLVSSQHAMLALDADEIPPGLLVLGGLGEQAARMARADLEAMKGKDHKVRVIAGGLAGAGVDAKWVELRRPMKDLDLRPIVEDVRRTIWRVFGVQPVEMGAVADVNRSTAEAQVDVGASHLITPILEVKQAKLNARVVPRLVKDERVRAWVRFEFDLDARRSPEAQQALAETHAVHVRNGTMTRNEVRAEWGLPAIEGGDVATVEEGGLLVSVASLATRGGGRSTPAPEAPPVPEPPPDPEGDGPDGGGGSDTPAPGEAAEGRPSGRKGQIMRAADPDLPSDWQPTGRFRGKRTVDLRTLAREVGAYARDVRPLYADAAAEIQREVAAAWTDGGFAPEAAARLDSRIDAALDRLAADWAAATEPRYRAAARIARRAADAFTHADPLGEDWEALGEAWSGVAMSHLTAPEGLVGTVRSRLHAIVAAATRGATRAKAQPAVAPDVSAADGEDALLEAALLSFESNAHRIDNWSGKLVEEASELTARGLTRAAGPPGDPGEWMVQWVSVLDGNTCRDCDYEGRRGFIPVSALTRYPASHSVQCGARDRCVLVFWTRAEVDSGEAVDLSGQ